MTESLDSDANVIWGARISEEMKGKVTVMTIITGVTSPWILGGSPKGSESSGRNDAPSRKTVVDSDLGIEIVS